MTNFSATYSPDDNKLRLYSATRLPSDVYERLKAAGFKWAPKQDLFVAPMWTPGREDLLLELCGEIGDEDTSLVDRAEERAERFGDYSEKRASDAETAREAVAAIADGIPLGQPILVGHHSEARARKDAERIQNGMRRAVRMWETSEYWKSRAAGAIRHAKYKERPDVRARRIKGLEADKRKQERAIAEAEKFLKAWRIEGLTQALATRIANFDHLSGSFPLADYPRQPPASQYEGPMSIWNALTDGIITAEQARDIAIPAHERRIAYARRWLAHIENRLAYERAMLGEAGGTVADRTRPEKGGACRCWVSPRGGWSFIQKVNRVSVTVLHTYGHGPDFPVTVPFDKLAGIMTAAEVEQARADGRVLGETDRGFILVSAIAAKPDQQPSAPEPSDFEAMKRVLREGVKVVAAPQLFPTPPELAARMVEIAGIGAGHRVLEPSAGTGRLLDPLFSDDGADWLLGKDGSLVAIELNHDLAGALRRQYVAVDVRTADFLECGDELGIFDRIVMNPPFANGQDIAHIKHALRFLAPGGRLVAICANGPRQDAQLRPLCGRWEPLPAGAFREEGTDVNAALLVIDAQMQVATRRAS